MKRHLCKIAMPSTTPAPVHWALGAAVLLVLLASCGQKDPTFRPLGIVLAQGDVIVTSSVPGASISMDGLTTGLVTPDTLLAVLAGGHRISLFLGGYFSASDSIMVAGGAITLVHFDLVSIPTTGDVAVTAPFPAAILLDGTPTGLTVPDTLRGIAPGTHAVSIGLAGFRPAPATQTIDVIAGETATAAFDLTVPKKIVCEDISNVGCMPCPAADAALQAVIASEEPGRVVSLNPHGFWPDAGDPFFQANTVPHCARVFFTGISVMPTIFVDGLAVGDPQSQASIRARVAERSMPTSPVAIGVRGQLAGSVYRVTVDAWGVADGIPSDLVLFTCIVETEVILNPPGPNGQSHYVNVLREILPQPQGDCSSGVTPGGQAIALTRGAHRTFQFDYPVAGGIDPSRLAAIVFAQEPSSKLVVQTGTSFEPSTAPFTARKVPRRSAVNRSNPIQVR